MARVFERTSLEFVRVGDMIRDGRRTIKVDSVEPCQRRGHVHINKRLCYDWRATTNPVATYTQKRS